MIVCRVNHYTFTKKFFKKRQQFDDFEKKVV